MQTPVLIVGAGPTGLVLALWLTKRGIPCRIIDRNPGPGLRSRAMVVQARTLEFYRQLGIAEKVVEQGIKAKIIHLMEKGREVAQLQFGDIGQGISPYPYALSFPQDDHEKLLGVQLSKLGVRVEWDTELLHLEDQGDVVRAELNSEQIEAQFVCGCDGARSTIRSELGLGFPGGTYDSVFFVADVEAPSQTVGEDGFNMCLGDRGFILAFPIRSSGSFRLIGLLPDELRSEPDVTFADLNSFVQETVGVETTAVHWFSTYHVHHRVADHFRVGRVFLAGDAGHIHSPAGGQGMNTGIGDAVNLAWKLAHVIRGGNPDIFGSYESERLAFARALVATTDRAFQLIVGKDFTSRMARELIPHLAPFVLGFTPVRRAAFGLVSQTKINYHDSSLSQGAVGNLRGGDRLPWVESLDNFASLASLDWQVHAYGTASEEVKNVAHEIGVRNIDFPWTDDAEAAGFEREAIYLVRPDGYIGFCGKHGDLSALRSYASEYLLATDSESPDAKPIAPTE